MGNGGHKPMSDKGCAVRERLGQEMLQGTATEGKSAGKRGCGHRLPVICLARCAVDASRPGTLLPAGRPAAPASMLCGAGLPPRARQLLRCRRACQWAKVSVTHSAPPRIPAASTTTFQGQCAAARYANTRTPTQCLHAKINSRTKIKRAPECKTNTQRHTRT